MKMTKRTEILLGIIMISYVLIPLYFIFTLDNFDGYIVCYAWIALTLFIDYLLPRRFKNEHL